jgi:hypothetical protein
LRPPMEGSFKAISFCRFLKRRFFFLETKFKSIVLSNTQTSYIPILQFTRKERKLKKLYISDKWHRRSKSIPSRDFVCCCHRT